MYITQRILYSNNGCLVPIVSWKVRGARGVMVIFVRNGHGDTSSNPGWDIAFHIALIPLGKGMNPIILPPAMGK